MLELTRTIKLTNQPTPDRHTQTLSPNYQPGLLTWFPSDNKVCRNGHYFATRSSDYFAYAGHVTHVCWMRKSYRNLHELEASAGRQSVRKQRGVTRHAR